MKKVLVLAIVAGMLLAGAVSVDGSVYYVAQSSAGSGDGSSYDNRMNVADHDGSTFSPGDVIYLVDTISSRLTIPGSGIEGEGNRIVYRGDYPGHPGVLTANTSYGTIRGIGKDYLIIDGLEIKNGMIAIAFLNGCDYITIKNCVIHDMTSKGIHFSANITPIVRNSNVVIGGAEGEGNEVYNVGVDTGGVDIGLAHVDDFIVSYNKCYGGEPDTGIDGVTTNYSDGGVIEYNELYDHIKSTGTEFGENSVDLKGCSNIHVRYNHMYGNRAGGVIVNHSDWMNADCSNIYIYHNLIYENNSNIVISDLDANCYVWGNIIHTSTKSHGISCSNDGTNIHIYNNTLINNNGDGTDYQLLIGGGSSNYYVKNNIFYSDTYAQSNRLIYKGTVTNANFDNNRYYYYNGDVKFYWAGEGTAITLAQVQAIGQEANGSEGLPGFSDVSNDDYTLAVSSACIDAGSDLGVDYALGLDPANTDFTTFPPSVYTLNQNNSGFGWEIGAYVFTGVACFPIDQTGWSLVYVDSEELVEDDGYPAENSFDGDPDTFWSTKWSLPDPEFYHPHEIQINLGSFYDICGFRYLPRQDDGPGDENGMIDEYEFYVSSDGVTWGTAVVSGTLVKDKTEKQVSFDHTLGQYIRLVALSEVNGNPWTTMAELNVLAIQPDSDINNDGKVNIEDFAVLSVWWDDENVCSTTDWCEGADFDMSGTIDMLDLTYFAENWLRQ